MSFLPNPTACQWRITAGDLAGLTLVKDVPIGSIHTALGATSSVSIHEQQQQQDGHPLGSSSICRIPLATIAVKYVGLNFADMFACLGLYSATPKGSFVPGLEFSGVIEAVNEEAGANALPPKGMNGDSTDFSGDYTGRGYKVGDEVFGVTRFGGYTTRLHADTRYIRRLPRGYSLAEGAALAAQALTAWYGLVELGGMGVGFPRPLQLKHWKAEELERQSSTNKMSSGSGSTVAAKDASQPPSIAMVAESYAARFIPRLDRIKASKRKVALIHSGGGGTGLWCLHICRYFNVDVVTTVGSATKKVALEKMFSVGGGASPKTTCLASNGLPSTSRLRVIDRSACDHSDAARRQALAGALKSLEEEAAAQNHSSATIEGGFDYVFDSLQGPWFQPSYDAMRAQGKHLVLGAGSMTPHGARVNWLSMAYNYFTRPTVDPLTIMSVNKSVMGFNLIWLFDNVEEVGEFLDSVVEMIQYSTTSDSGVPSAEKAGSDGKSRGDFTPLRPTIGKLYEHFTDLPEALREFQSGSTMGKVVVSTQLS